MRGTGNSPELESEDKIDAANRLTSGLCSAALGIDAANEKDEKHSDKTEETQERNEESRKGIEEETQKRQNQKPTESSEPKTWALEKSSKNHTRNR